jgi:hypothetical protein
VNYCVDCKHYIPMETLPDNPEHAFCALGVQKPHGPMYHLVSPNATRELHRCANMRADDWPCGITGKLFEPKAKAAA